MLVLPGQAPLLPGVSSSLKSFLLIRNARAFLGRSRAQDTTVHPLRGSGGVRAMYPRKSKLSNRAFFTEVLDLVERQPKFGHHRFRPRQCFLRVAAAEND